MGYVELATAPVFEAMHAAAAGGDHALVALDHRGHLLALVGMDQENDLVVPHGSSLRIVSRPQRGLRGAARRLAAGLWRALPDAKAGATVDTEEPAAQGSCNARSTAGRFGQPPGD